MNLNQLEGIFEMQIVELHSCPLEHTFTIILYNLYLVQIFTNFDVYSDLRTI